MQSVVPVRKRVMRALNKAVVWRQRVCGIALLLCAGAATGGEAGPGVAFNGFGPGLDYQIRPDGSVLAFGDVQVGRQESPSANGARRKRAVFQPLHGDPWPDGIVYYEFAAGLDRYSWEVVQEAMRHIEALTNVRFVADASQPYRLRIETRLQGADGVCGTSFAGRVPLERQPQLLTLACPGMNTALHELLHALGFLHEGDTRGKRDANAVLDRQSVMLPHRSQFHSLSNTDRAGINRHYPGSPRAPERGVHPAYSGRLDEPVVGQAKPYLLKAMLDGECLEVLPREWDRGSPGRFRAVQVSRCQADLARQQWHYTAQGRIRNVAYPDVCLSRQGVRQGVVAAACSSPQVHWRARGGRVVLQSDPDEALYMAQGDVLVGVMPEDRAEARWYWMEASSVAVPVSPLSPFGPTVAPGATRQPVSYRQLRSLANRQCLTVLEDPAKTPGYQGKVGLRPCNARITGQRWQHEANGRVRSQVFAGACLGRVAFPSALARAGSGQVRLMSCNAASAVRWRLSGEALHELSFPELRLDHRDMTVVDGPARGAGGWGQWQWL